MKRQRIHHTAHFEQRLRERGVDIRQVVETIKSPHRRLEDKRVPGLHGGRRFRFYRTFSNIELCVVAEVKKTDVWILTCWPVEK